MFRRNLLRLTSGLVAAVVAEEPLRRFWPGVSLPTGNRTTYPINPGLWTEADWDVYDTEYALSNGQRGEVTTMRATLWKVDPRNNPDIEFVLEPYAPWEAGDTALRIPIQRMPIRPFVLDDVTYTTMLELGRKP